MRSVLYPGLAPPDPSIRFDYWRTFVGEAVAIGVCLVIVGAIAFVVMLRRSRRKAREASLTSPLVTLSSMAPPLFAGWLAGGLCEWRWIRVCGGVPKPVASTMLHISVCVAIWSGASGVLLLVLLSPWRRNLRLGAASGPSPDPSPLVHEPVSRPKEIT